MTLANAFFVAPNGNDSWSGRLDAPNADGTDGPFASLERARDAMRAGAVKTTYVRGGTYRLGATLELTAADNGVRIEGYSGETPVISGGERVTGFVAEGDGRYSAAVARPTDLDLAIGGVRQKVAQSGDWNAGDPHSGWLVLDQAASGPSTTAIRYRGGDVDPALLQAGLKIQTFSTDRLADGIAAVADIDAASQTIRFQQAVQYAPKTGGTYRLLNAPALIRDAGEFAWRASDGRLVVKPQDAGALLAEGAVVPRLGTLVVLNGAGGVTLSGLSFADGTWNGAALSLNGGGGNTVTRNGFANVGTAIRLTGSSGNTITANRMESLGANGVELTYGSNANLVDSNAIAGIGRITKRVAAVMAYGVADNTVSHNAISDSPGYGISFKNWDGGTVNTGNRILYNRITDTGRETADTAAIEVLGRSDIDTRMTILGNWIDGVGGLATDGNGGWIDRHKSFGIYLDDQANGISVRDNFIRNTGWASVFIHGGDNNDVQNNIAVTANPGERFLRLEWQPTAGDAGRPRNNTIVRNVVQSSTGGDYWTLYTPGNFQLDGNLVSGGRRYGANDRNDDPGFIDVAAGDFRLRAGSAAAALGIHDLDWEQMGRFGVPAAPTAVPPTAPASFDPLAYLAANPDLMAAFGTDTAAATQHYLQYGRAEGRGTTFDALSYVAAYGDLAAAFGTDTAAAMRHYIQSGRIEGRSPAFDAGAYLASYGDLAAAFGGDLAAAARHYIQYGRLEGRGVRLAGTAAANWLQGGAGNDALTGGGGDDTLDGGAGLDWVTLGDAGGTVLVTAAETLRGGAGIDAVRLGGTGNAVLVARIEDLAGSAGGDWVTLTDLGHTMTVTGVETLRGGAGADVITLGGVGNAVIMAAIDTLTGSTGGDWITLSNLGSTMTVTGVETLRGGAGNDVVTLGGNGNAMIMAAV
ncbi:right-handed parallel beta-helix repeat-containing protein, partial [Azospirillum sp. TSO22-1]|uniref:right-handed parallel beta-helix repeat-containing protein n=1 Tax=Azospirillum sp. TSO22-1 TaxID=716789 RepID=UPI000D65D58F